MTADCWILHMVPICMLAAMCSHTRRHPLASQPTNPLIHCPPALSPQLLMCMQMPAVELLSTSHIMNQMVGDAIGGVLLAEAVFRRGFSLDEWMGLYTDLPSRQLKLKVADRNAITTTDAERRCVSPAGMQAAIDAAVAGVARGRAFARPSGTEDAVRVYAEAESQAAADELARQVMRIVFDMAGGVGERP